MRLILSGVACPGPGAAVPGLRADLLRLFRAYTLAASGDSFPPCPVPLFVLSPFVFPSLRLPFCYSLSIRAARGGFALLSFALSPFSSVYSPLFSVFRLISSVILSFYLSERLVYCFIFYSIQPGIA